MLHRVLVFLLIIWVIVLGLASWGEQVVPGHTGSLAVDLTATLGGDREEGILRFRYVVENKALQPAKNLQIDLVLHPELTKRLKSINVGNSVKVGALAPGSSYVARNGFITFDSHGLTKEEIAQFEPLLQLKLTWIQNGKQYHKIVHH